MLQRPERHGRLLRQGGLWGACLVCISVHGCVLFVCDEAVAKRILLNSLNMMAAAGQPRWPFQAPALTLPPLCPALQYLPAALDPNRTDEFDLCNQPPNTCTGGNRLQQLALAGAGLDCGDRGLPPSFIKLMELQTLDLALNNIGGSTTDLAAIIGHVSTAGLGAAGRGRLWAGRY